MIDRGGNVISQFGDVAVMDVTIIAALAAGSFAATKELARRIGEVEFNALYHQGNGSHIFMNSVDDDTIMITVFGPRTTVGLVRFYSAATALAVSELLKSLDTSGGHGFTFDAADVTATPIFVDHPLDACSARVGCAAEENGVELCYARTRFAGHVGRLRNPGDAGNSSARFMAVQFRDYYETLGVAKTASADEIKSAFRKLARKHHPDMAKPKEKAAAEEKFKQINEAYEVLSDPEKRSKYDQLGADWNQPGGFQPPPDWGRGGTGGGFRRYAGGNGGVEFEFGGTGFSDFFEAFFGGGRGESAFGGGFGRRPATAERGQDVEADIMVTLEEALHGSTRQVSLRRSDSEKVETYQVKIPRGVHEGQRIRLAGQGEAGARGGKSGDLFLRVRLARHPDFSVEGNDLVHEVTLDAVAGGARHRNRGADVGRLSSSENSAGHPGRPAFSPARSWAAGGDRRSRQSLRGYTDRDSEKVERRRARTLATARRAEEFVVGTFGDRSTSRRRFLKRAE